MAVQSYDDPAVIYDDPSVPYDGSETPAGGDPATLTIVGMFDDVLELTGSFVDSLELTGIFDTGIELTGRYGEVAVTTPASSMYLGEDKAITDTIYQSDGTTLENITGWAVSAVLHAWNDPSTVYFTKTTGGGGIVLTSPTLGLLTITVLAADTSNLKPGAYQLRVMRTDSGEVCVLTLIDLTLQQK